MYHISVHVVRVVLFSVGERVGHDLLVILLQGVGIGELLSVNGVTSQSSPVVVVVVVFELFLLTYWDKIKSNELRPHFS
jgi:hypothetical protein